MDRLESSVDARLPSVLKVPAIGYIVVDFRLCLAVGSKIEAALSQHRSDSLKNMLIYGNRCTTII